MWETVRTIRAATVRERFCLRTQGLAQVLLFVLVCLGAGCESGFGARQQNDPMLGFSAAPKPAAQSSAPGNAVVQATSGPIPVPPMPSSYSAPGTAPVAGGEAATPESTRDLRMAGGSLSPSKASSSAAVRGAAPGVTVGNPEPASAGTTSHLMPAPAPSPTGSGANIRSYEEAQQYLKQQRVNWQRLDMEDGQWKFQCGIPNLSNPQINRTYATSKAFPDPLSAISEVIAQIEKK